MAEYIEREAAINACYDGFADCRDDCATNIKAIPAADVVEVVRCRECVHCCGVSGKPPFKEADEAYCDEHDWCVSETYFCADGKRKDGGQDDV